MKSRLKQYIFLLALPLAWATFSACDREKVELSEVMALCASRSTGTSNRAFYFLTSAGKPTRLNELTIRFTQGGKNHALDRTESCLFVPSRTQGLLTVTRTKADEKDSAIVIDLSAQSAVSEALVESKLKPVHSASSVDACGADLPSASSVGLKAIDTQGQDIVSNEIEGSFLSSPGAKIKSSPRGCLFVPRTFSGELIVGDFRIAGNERSAFVDATHFKSGATHPVTLVPSASRDDLLHCGEFISKETLGEMTKAKARLLRPARALGTTSKQARFEICKNGPCGSRDWSELKNFGAHRGAARLLPSFSRIGSCLVVGSNESNDGHSPPHKLKVTDSRHVWSAEVTRDQPYQFKRESDPREFAAYNSVRVEGCEDTGAGRTIARGKDDVLRFRFDKLPAAAGYAVSGDKHPRIAVTLERSERAVAGANVPISREIVLENNTAILALGDVAGTLAATEEAVALDVRISAANDVGDRVEMGSLQSCRVVIHTQRPVLVSNHAALPRESFLLKVGTTFDLSLFARTESRKAMRWHYAFEKDPSAFPVDMRRICENSASVQGFSPAPASLRIALEKPGVGYLRIVACDEAMQGSEPVDTLIQVDGTAPHFSPVFVDKSLQPPFPHLNRLDKPIRVEMRELSDDALPFETLAASARCEVFYSQKGFESALPWKCERMKNGIDAASRTIAFSIVPTLDVFGGGGVTNQALLVGGRLRVKLSVAQDIFGNERVQRWVEALVSHEQDGGTLRAGGGILPEDLAAGMVTYSVQPDGSVLGLSSSGTLYQLKGSKRTWERLGTFHSALPRGAEAAWRGLNKPFCRGLCELSAFDGKSLHWLVLRDDETYRTARCELDVGCTYDDTLPTERSPTNESVLTEAVYRCFPKNDVVATRYWSNDRAILVQTGKTDWTPAETVTLSSIEASTCEVEAHIELKPGPGDFTIQPRKDGWLLVGQGENSFDIPSELLRGSSSTRVVDLGRDLTPVPLPTVFGHFHRATIREDFVEFADPKVLPDGSVWYFSESLEPRREGALPVSIVSAADVSTLPSGSLIVLAPDNDGLWIRRDNISAVVPAETVFWDTFDDRAGFIRRPADRDRDWIAEALLGEFSSVNLFRCGPSNEYQCVMNDQEELLVYGLTEGEDRPPLLAKFQVWPHASSFDSYGFDRMAGSPDSKPVFRFVWKTKTGGPHKETFFVIDSSAVTVDPQ